MDSFFCIYLHPIKPVLSRIGQVKTLMESRGRRCYVKEGQQKDTKTAIVSKNTNYAGANGDGDNVKSETV